MQMKQVVQLAVQLATNVVTFTIFMARKFIFHWYLSGTNLAGQVAGFLEHKNDNYCRQVKSA
jgi:hypothetical protein